MEDKVFFFPKHIKSGEIEKQMTVLSSFYLERKEERQHLQLETHLEVFPYPVSFLVAYLKDHSNLEQYFFFTIYILSEQFLKIRAEESTSVWFYQKKKKKEIKYTRVCLFVFFP